MKNGNDYRIVTPEEVSLAMARRCRRLRLLRRWKQSTLAERAGVSLGSLRRFEQTGRASLRNLLRIALVLGRLGDFEELFSQPEADSIEALEAMSSHPQPKRGAR